MVLCNLFLFLFVVVFPHRRSESNKRLIILPPSFIVALSAATNPPSNLGKQHGKFTFSMTLLLKITLISAVFQRKKFLCDKMLLLEETLAQQWVGHHGNDCCDVVSPMAPRRLLCAVHYVTIIYETSFMWRPDRSHDSYGRGGFGLPLTIASYLGIPASSYVSIISRYCRHIKLIRELRALYGLDLSLFLLIGAI